MKFSNFFNSLLLIGAFGCASPGAPPVNPLCATVWRIPQSPEPLHLNFTPDGRLVGVLGANRFFAPVTYRPGGEIEIAAVASTRVGTLPEFAPRFFAALNAARYSRITGDKLELFDRDRRKVMTLRAASK